MATTKKKGRPAKMALTELPPETEEIKVESLPPPQPSPEAQKLEELEKSFKLQSEEYAKLLDKYTDMLKLFQGLTSEEALELSGIVLSFYLKNNHIPLRKKLRKLQLLLENVSRVL